MGAGVNESSVAQFLLSKGFLLTALELHQELLEENNGYHNVTPLYSYFNSKDSYVGRVKATETRVRENRQLSTYQATCAYDASTQRTRMPRCVLHRPSLCVQ